MKFKQDEIINHLKNYGFVFNSSEIYNGLSNAWDYGPLGVLLKNNIKQKWWKEFVTKTTDMVGLDSSIILNPLVWEASGHLKNFSDPLIDCRNCKNRFRADKLIEEYLNISVSENTDQKTLEDLMQKINCPNCNKKEWTEIRKFNLMYKTYQGVVENAKSELYLRPETAQGIFINFKNIQRSMRLKLPFGVAQIGKSFRNEITPGNFIFRTREFEQMEIEYFFNPNKSSSNEIFDGFQNKIESFLVNTCLINRENLLIQE
ncbi:MAG: glycine--tRNA ligase, partial [Ureaplasma sp.]|nr:glycine--tRNA ligase [Ureaplasma sp.]